MSKDLKHGELLDITIRHARVIGVGGSSVTVAIQTGEHRWNLDVPLTAQVTVERVAPAVADPWTRSAAALLGVPAERLEALGLRERERQVIDDTPVTDLALIASIVRRADCADHETRAAA